MNIKEFTISIAFLAFYYYTKPENAAAAVKDNKPSYITVMFKWITQHLP